MFRLRDNFDEMRRSLEAKENALEALHQSIFEKEQVLHAIFLMPKSFPWLNFLQMLEQVRGLLQASEEKRQASIAELSTKLQM
ncbi:hypothetical protein GW17_00038273, partial [Ensete ventricosum]